MKETVLPILKKFGLYIIVAIVTLLVYVFFIEQPIHDWMELRGYRKQIKDNTKQVDYINKRLDTLYNDKTTTLQTITEQQTRISTLESDVVRLKYPRKKPTDPVTNAELNDAINILKQHGK